MSTEVEPIEDHEADQGAFIEEASAGFPHLRKRYWGRHLWARGYFCASVGQVTEEQIREYIEGHDEEPPDENFNIEG